jgi:hypothetical protein
LEKIKKILDIGLLKIFNQKREVARIRWVRSYYHSTGVVFEKGIISWRYFCVIFLIIPKD